MTKKNANKWRVRLDDKNHDAVLTRYSRNGDAEIDVIFEWQTIGQRNEVVSIHIKTAKPNSVLTASDIRSIPFSELETMQRQKQLKRPDAVVRGWQLEVDTGPKSGKSLTVAELKIVADLYREARNTGIPTARHIAKQLEISESAVGKRISAARKAGLLGAALGTKAGERPTRTTGKRK